MPRDLQTNATVDADVVVHALLPARQKQIAGVAHVVDSEALVVSGLVRRRIGLMDTS